MNELYGFIQEHDIISATTDIEISKTLAEINVLESLVESYAKYAMICEYADDSMDINTFITEADASAPEVEGENKEEKKKTAVDKGSKAKTSIWQKLMKLLKTIADGIYRIFNSTSLKGLIKKCEAVAAKEPNKLVYAPYEFTDIVTVFECYADLITILDNPKHQTATDVRVILNRVEAISKNTYSFSELSGEKGKETGTVTSRDTSSKFISITELLKQLKDIENSDITVQCNNLSKTMDKLAKKASVGEDRVFFTFFTNTVNAIMSVYTSRIKQFIQLEKDIVKPTVATKTKTK